MDKYYKHFQIHTEDFIDSALQNIYDDFGEEESDFVNSNMNYRELMKLVEEFNDNIELLFTLNKDDYSVVKARFKDVTTALEQVKLMREGKLEKKNIHEFLEEL